MAMPTKMVIEIVSKVENYSHTKVTLHENEFPESIIAGIRLSCNGVLVDFSGKITFIPSKETYWTKKVFTYKSGVLYSYEDQPSVVYNDIYIDSSISFWHKNGELHRETGPARISTNDSTHTWYLNGYRLPYDKFLSALDSDEKRLMVILEHGYSE